jgi:Thiamine pyrophosphate enzyme, C-terminal TPP binding domain
MADDPPSPRQSRIVGAQRTLLVAVGQRGTEDDRSAPIQDMTFLSFDSGRLADYLRAQATGDGSFGFNAMEIDTAARHKAPVLIVVSNNGSWAIEVRDQQETHGKVVGTRLQYSDYAAMARAFGLHGERAERVEDLPAAIERALANCPALLDVLVTRRRCHRTPSRAWRGCPTCSRLRRGTTPNASGARREQRLAQRLAAAASPTQRTSATTPTAPPVRRLRRRRPNSGQPATSS